MVFTTCWFMISALVFFLCYWSIKSPGAKSALLLAFCFLFHSHFAGASGMLPILILALITYTIGRTGSRRLCVLGVVLCVSALCFYKYSRFLTGDLLAHMNLQASAQLDSFLNAVLPVTPPLAISFFTFEFVHYLLEVRKGGQPIRTLCEFMQFTIFFPSLVAGPIKRYGQFIPALQEGLNHFHLQNVMRGLIQVACGYFQKVVLADNLAGYIASRGPNFEALFPYERWIFLIALAFRIYFDFNGYSDIAIGLAKMLGVELPANFNRPYLAKNIRDFWQRWHISLSSWIRDYIYIPLGGGKHGLFRKVVNGLIAFALCGLWHGAAWNFVVWGLYHGLGLAASSMYASLPVVRHLSPFFARNPAISWFITFMFVAFGWLLFFYPLPTAVKMFCLLFGVSP